MASRGRRVAIVVAVGAICAVVVPAVFWRDIAAGYYLRRLRTEPVYLEVLIVAPKGSVREEAVSRFVSTEQGAEAVVTSFVSACTDAFALGDDFATLDFAFIAYSARAASIRWRGWGLAKNAAGERVTDDFAGSGTVPDRDHFGRIASWLPHIRHVDVVLPRWPELTFTVIGPNRIRVIRSGSTPSPTSDGAGADRRGLPSKAITRPE